MPTLWLALLCLAGFGYFSAINSPVQYAMIQLLTPDHLLGRINSLWTAQNVRRCPRCRADWCPRFVAAAGAGCRGVWLCRDTAWRHDVADDERIAALSGARARAGAANIMI